MRRPFPILLALAAACRGAEPGSSALPNDDAPPGAPRVTEPAAPIAVRVAVDPSLVAANGSVRITVTATNTTGAARTLQFSSGCTTDFELLDASCAVAWRSAQMCTQALTEETLGAGESLTGRHVLERDAPGTMSIAPGVYRVRGVLLTMGDPVRSEPVAVTFR